MSYAIRDRRGHFVAPLSREGKICPHKCCKGRRPHPADRPLIPDRAVLRALTDDQLARAIDWDDPKSVQRVMAEADRRDRVHQRELERARRVGQRVRYERMMRDEHEIAKHAAYIQAEHETRGHMLSRDGQRAGVDPRTLWDGPRRRADKYASEELREYWGKHGRTTWTEFRRQARHDRDQEAA